MKAVSSGSATDLKRCLESLRAADLKQYLKKKCGPDKGSVIHTLISTHIKHKDRDMEQKLDLLVKYGALLHQLDIYGNNAVIHGVKLGRKNAMQWMIKECDVACVLGRNHYGMNVCHIAALRGHWHAFDMVVRKVGREKFQGLLHKKTTKPFSRYIPAINKTIIVK